MKRILISIPDSTLDDLDRIATLSNEFIANCPNRSRAVRIAASGWLSAYDDAIKRTKGSD